MLNLTDRIQIPFLTIFRQWYETQITGKANIIEVSKTHCIYEYFLKFRVIIRNLWLGGKIENFNGLFLAQLFWLVCCTYDKVT